MSLNRGTEVTKRPKDTHPWFYRENTQAITKKVNALVSTSLRPSVKEWRSVYYPCLTRPIHDVLTRYFDIKNLKLVTRKEQEDVYIVLSYMMKRAINWLRQFRDESNTSTSIWKELSDRRFLSNIGWFLPIHDAIHCVCRYMKDPENQAKDPQRYVPAIFRVEYTWWNETRETVEEEILAWIWVPWTYRETILSYKQYLETGGNIPFWQHCIDVSYARDLSKKTTRLF